MNFKFKGAYSNTTTYMKLDVVSYTNVSTNETFFYLCLIDNTVNASPTHKADNANWGWLNVNSNFPNSVDNFLFKADPQLADKPEINRIIELNNKATLTPTEQSELNSLAAKHRNKLNLADDMNKLQDSIANLQIFFKDKIDGKLNQNIQDIDQQTLNGLNQINTKMQNVISYLDGTTAGQLRNDIGVMGDLTTGDKSSLVNALNEVNNKAVDLSPIENQLVTLQNELDASEQSIINLQQTVNAHNNDDMMHYQLSNGAILKSLGAADNLNDVINTGFYTNSGATTIALNYPMALSLPRKVLIEVFNSGGESSWLYQRFTYIDNQEPHQYIRARVLDTWGAWVEEINSKQQNWIIGTVSGGWTRDDFRYFKDNLGIVHLSGQIISTANSVTLSPIFTLPVGYRPISMLRNPLGHGSNGNCTLVVQTSGACSIAGTIDKNSVTYGFNFTFRAVE